MKLKAKPAEKIETQMAPMIDVVFQLLIFFMLTLKIIEPEGDFNINMPLSAPAEQVNDINLPVIKVRLIANPQNGLLTKLVYGKQVLGDNGAGMSDDEASTVFARLNKKIETLGGGAMGARNSDQEVEIDADYDLHYRFVIQAVSSCTGKMQDGKLIRFIEKIKFAAPKEKAEAG